MEGREKKRGGGERAATNGVGVIPLDRAPPKEKEGHKKEEISGAAGGMEMRHRANLRRRWRMRPFKIVSEAPSADLPFRGLGNTRPRVDGVMGKGGEYCTSFPSLTAAQESR